MLFVALALSVTCSHGRGVGNCRAEPLGGAGTPMDLPWAMLSLRGFISSWNKQISILSSLLCWYKNSWLTFLVWLQWKGKLLIDTTAGKRCPAVQFTAATLQQYWRPKYTWVYMTYSKGYMWNITFVGASLSLLISLQNLFFSFNVLSLGMWLSMNSSFFSSFPLPSKWLSSHLQCVLVWDLNLQILHFFPLTFLWFLGG